MTSASLDAPLESAAGPLESGRSEADHHPPPEGLPLELAGRAGAAGSNGSISELELMALLGDAYQADAWPEIEAPDLAAPPTPSSALADHAAGSGQAPPGGGDPAPRFPPPDLEPAAAKRADRQLGQAEIDALLAQLLGS